MFLLGVPLLIFSFAIYNIVAFILPGFSWSMEIVRFQLASGGDCAITAGDLMIAVLLSQRLIGRKVWTK